MNCSVKTDYFKIGMLESATLNTSGKPAQTPIVVTNHVEKISETTKTETFESKDTP